MRLAPSMLASDLSQVADVLQEMEAGGISLVHWDVMDGHFVPSLTFGPGLIAAARACCQLEFDVHLMVENPESYLESLHSVGVWMISFHIEATRFAPRFCNQIRRYGIKPSVALNPQTGLASVEHLLDFVDNVLVMTVDPGFGGQSLLQSSWRKLEQLAALRHNRALEFTIEVDGGVDQDNALRLAQLGVDIAVAGTAYFSAPDRRHFASMFSA